MGRRGARRQRPTGRDAERPRQGAQHEVVHLPAVAEPHLQFLGMRVDVDQLWIELEVQQVGRLPPVVQHVAIPEARRIGEQPVAHGATVDEEELLVALRARGLGWPIQPDRRTGPDWRSISRQVAAKSSPITVAMRWRRASGVAATGTSSSTRLPWRSRKATSKRLSAKRSTSRTTCDSSVLSVRTNLRRAGTL